VFLHSHAGKKSDLVERAVFTFVAPVARIRDPPRPQNQVWADRVASVRSTSRKACSPSILVPGDVNGVVGNGDSRFPWTYV
jgi:hypothetical protein